MQFACEDVAEIAEVRIQGFATMSDSACICIRIVIVYSYSCTYERMYACMYACRQACIRETTTTTEGHLNLGLAMRIQGQGFFGFF